MDEENSQGPSSNPNMQKLGEDLKNPSPVVAPTEVASEIAPVVPPEEPKKSSSLPMIAGLLIIAAIISVAAYFLIPKYFGLGATPQTCTADAKVCSDGSAVGRTGPNCEFEACPAFVPIPTETPMTTASASATPAATAKATSTPTSSPSASPSSY